MSRTLAFLFSIAAAGAQAAPFAAITVENDFFAGYDRHYTNGVQFAWQVARNDVPGLARIAPFAWSDAPDFVVAVGQRMYTPADTDSARADPRDRPYAGWLYAVADIKTRSEASVDHVLLGIGIVGPAALGGRTQNAIHRVIGDSRANGWSNQLRNEPTILVGFERTWPAAFRGDFHASQFDIAPRVAVTLGNALTYASAGLVARLGRNLPADIPVTHISLGPSRDGYRGTPSLGWYVWAGIDVRAVSRNIFIDGNSFRDGPGVDRSPFGHDLQAGAAVAWSSGRVAFVFVQRSREFRGQDKADRFGQLSLSFPF